MRRSRKVDITIDGKKIKTVAKDIELTIDGRKVLSTNDLNQTNSFCIEDLQWTSLKALLNASDSAFGHIDRFRIVKSLGENLMSFTEVKELLNTTSPTANFHLKTLLNGTIVYKDENGKYALTLLGDLILDYFLKFLEEANRLQNTINSREEV